MCLIANIEKTNELKNNPEFKGKQVVYKVLEVVKLEVIKTDGEVYTSAPMRPWTFGKEMHQMKRNKYVPGVNISDRLNIEINDQDDQNWGELAETRVVKGFHFCTDLMEAKDIVCLLSKQYRKRFVIVSMEVDAKDFVAIGTFSDWSKGDFKHLDKNVVYTSCIFTEEEYNKAINQCA